jgi:hypothetical protein
MSLATALHLRNHGFRWEDHDGPLRRVTPDEARQFDEQGFVLLEGLLEAASVEVARDATNLSPAMRKAYILQYAAAGTRVWPGDDEPRDLDDPQAQFVVAAEGRPV